MNSASEERDAFRPARPGAEPRMRTAERILRNVAEKPDALVELVGPARAAAALRVPLGAVEAMLRARPATRRRFARILRNRFGLSCADVEAAAVLPDDEALVRAVTYFGVALRLAGEPRVLPRDRRRALAETFGEDAVAFGLTRRAALVRHAGALDAIVGAQPGGNEDAALFVNALAAGGFPVAPAAALRLGVARPLEAAPVADAFGASIDALPMIAADALESAARTPAAAHEASSPAAPPELAERGAA